MGLVKEMTREMFEEGLRRAMGLVDITTLPGVMEVVREELNNDAIDEANHIYQGACYTCGDAFYDTEASEGVELGDYCSDECEQKAAGEE